MTSRDAERAPSSWRYKEPRELTMMEMTIVKNARARGMFAKFRLFPSGRVDLEMIGPGVDDAYALHARPIADTKPPNQ